eukprot:scpid73889/ scgid3179/ Inositol-pentakisphosphate 2-kinase; Inositol-1,3,4,5,6-pentakisphosphate 2-kinase; Ins(1,3,4,5,6)P5 2-kinase
MLGCTLSPCVLHRHTLLYRFPHFCVQIRQFSAACTAKDCSIMVSFQQCTPGLHQPEDRTVEVVTSAGVQRYAYNIAVVDLDIKEFQRVKKYFVEDHQVVSNYVAATQSKQDAQV